MQYNVKTLTAIGVATAALLVGSGTFAATPVTITGAGIYDPATLTASGLENTGEYASAVLFNATVGVGPSAQVETLYGFCVDLTHDIVVGFDTNAGHDIVSANGDAQAGVNYAYQTGTLTADSVGGASGVAGTTLTATQIGEIGGLAAYGRGLIDSADPSAAGFDSADLSDRLAGVQGAIWAIEYPTSTFTTTGPVESYIVSDVAAAPSHMISGPIAAIYSTDGSQQGFVLAQPHLGFTGGSFGGAAPEPATWGLMLVGAGLVGATVRRRRSLGALAA